MPVNFSNNKKIPLELQQGIMFEPNDKLEIKNKNKSNNKENKKTESKSKSTKNDKERERKEQIKNYKSALNISDQDIAYDFILRAIELIDNVLEELHSLRRERSGAIKK